MLDDAGLRAVFERAEHKHWATLKKLLGEALWRLLERHLDSFWEIPGEGDCILGGSWGGSLESYWEALGEFLEWFLRKFLGGSWEGC